MTLADEDPQSFVDVYADVLTMLHSFNVDVMSILISMVIFILILKFENWREIYDLKRGCLACYC